MRSCVAWFDGSCLRDSTAVVWHPIRRCICARMAMQLLRGCAVENTCGCCSGPWLSNGFDTLPHRLLRSAVWRYARVVIGWQRNFLSPCGGMPIPAVLRALHAWRFVSAACLFDCAVFIAVAGGAAALPATALHTAVLSPYACCSVTACAYHLNQHRGPVYARDVSPTG